MLEGERLTVPFRFYAPRVTRCRVIAGTLSLPKFGNDYAISRIEAPCTPVIMPMDSPPKQSASCAREPRHIAAEASKREAVVQAVAEAVHEVGPDRLTVAMIRKRGGIARCTFYELFGNAAEAFAFSWEASRERFASLLDQAAQQPVWRVRIAEAITALVEKAESEPYLLELYLAHGCRAESARGAFDDALVNSLASVLGPDRAARSELPQGVRLEEFIALGTLSVIAERLRRGERESWATAGAELIELATRGSGCHSASSLQ